MRGYGPHGRAAAGAAVLVLFACARDEAPAPIPFNVVVVLVDALRANHLGSYGYSRDTSPHIDSFARVSVLFSQTRSQAPCTYPSVNSLFTSRYPIHFLRQREGDFGIPARFPTLAEMLHGRGYRTAAVSASPIVRGSPSTFNQVGGFDRGFDVFDESCLKRDASCVNARAFPLLDGPAPFFLYLHYMEPHGPYLPPPAHERRFAVGYSGKDFIERGSPLPIAEMLYEGGPVQDLTETDHRHLVDLYDEEILYFDQHFQSLLDEIHRLGLWEQTVVVLLSDHGEEFLEHGDVKHCRNLYDTQTKTPLIVYIPGVPGGKRIEGNTQNLDILPTILDYLGLGLEAWPIDGRSLRAEIEARSDEARPAFGAWQDWRSIVDGQYKLLLNLRSDEMHLYDVARDPGELEDLRANRPDQVAALRSSLDAHLSAVEEDRARALAAGEEAMRRLKALGYLE